MRAALRDAEWNEAWAGYDQVVPSAPAAQPVACIRPSGNRKARSWAVLALVALALPMPTQLLCEDGAPRGIPREAVSSFSPAEMLLPPVEVALARLAAESASASCWVQQLRPQGSGCQDAAAPR
jgi:hypothetical protein